MSQQSPSCPENPWELGWTASKPTLPIELRCVDGLESSTLLLWKLSYHRKLLSVISEGVRRVPPAIAPRFDSEIKENYPFYPLEGPCLEHAPADEQGERVPSTQTAALSCPALPLEPCLQSTMWGLEQEGWQYIRHERPGEINE